MDLPGVYSIFNNLWKDCQSCYIISDTHFKDPDLIHTYEDRPNDEELVKALDGFVSNGKSISEAFKDVIASTKDGRKVKEPSKDATLSKLKQKAIDRAKTEEDNLANYREKQALTRAFWSKGKTVEEQEAGKATRKESLEKSLNAVKDALKDLSK